MDGGLEQVISHIVQFAGPHYTQLNNLLLETVCRGGSVFFSALLAKVSKT
jgi:hypothetical protein